MGNLILVRHLKTQFNRKSLINGLLDLGALMSFSHEANNIIEYLKNKQIDYIFSSPLKRAYETALYIKNKINTKRPIIMSKHLIERDFSVYEGRPVSIISTIKKVYNYEDNLEIEKRAKNFLKIINKLDGNIIATTHSHFIKAFLRVTNNNFEYTFKMNNTAFFAFDINKGKVTLQEYHQNYINDKLIENQE